ncbi:MAG TPA: alanine racemase [Steroidobacteraceae bacterium]|nr:alanine racemase [Steroidobacteraceae bacterium]
MHGKLPTTLHEAETPAIVLDRGKLGANCERVRSRCRALGVGLRPHMKTLKSIDAARLAVDPSHGGIAVATLNEAEYFAQHGFLDIQYAVCITADKLPRAARILARASRFSFFVDSLETARAVVDFARRHGTLFRVWLEIDSGEHRTGVDPHDPALVEIARVLSHSAVRLEGVATHAGHSYGAANSGELRDVAAQERLAVVQAADRLRAAGIAANGVSAGSTPTAMHLPEAEGLTELRAGVYMAGDLFQVAVGSLALDQVAVTVLASVISHSQKLNQVVVDAGGLALSKDRSTAAGPGPDMRYGLVLDALGRPIGSGLTVVDVHQEHGEIRSSTRLPFERLPIGSKIRIVPNHVCMTAAMYGNYLIVDGADAIVDVWERTNGWS